MVWGEGKGGECQYSKRDTILPPLLVTVMYYFPIQGTYLCLENSVER